MSTVVVLLLQGRLLDLCRPEFLGAWSKEYPYINAARRDEHPESRIKSFVAD
jgi:hypothetical protein